ncbi:MAG: alkaline phosphatase family protein [Actinomycetota bacterium]
MRKRTWKRWLGGSVVLASITLALTFSGLPGAPAATRAAGSPVSPITHIVFIPKENRSFDEYFGAFPDPGNNIDGSTIASCYDKAHPSNVTTFTMPSTPDPMPQDVSHAPSAFKTAYHGGKVDGFCHESRAIVKASGQDLADTQMRAGQIPNYWSYADSFGLGDRMFASWRGASFGNNVFAVSAQTGRYSTLLDRRAIYGLPHDPSSIPKYSWGCTNSAGTTVQMIGLDGSISQVYPCFGFQSLPNLMDANGVTWRYYSTQNQSHFIHSGIAAIQSIRCAPGDSPPCTQDNPYWNQHVLDGSKFFDAASAGNLPDVSWYLPHQTEHPPQPACTGENATVRAVNAVMSSPDWSSTAIVVWWDEWGGFYDHVKPPTADGTDAGITGLNSLLSYGFRVPLLVISPWVQDGPLAQQGYVSHTFYSDASFPRFVEWAFGLPTMGAADDLSTYTATEPQPGDLTDFFDFSGTAPKGKLLLNTHTCPAMTAAQRLYVRTHDPD